MSVHADAADDRPAWSRRIVRERESRGWTQKHACEVLRGHFAKQNPGGSLQGDLLRNWKRWEAGGGVDDFYKPLIAATFGTVTAILFPPERRNVDADLWAGTGMDSVELLARLRSSDLSTASLEALRVTTERLCSEYPYKTSTDLYVDSRDWLRRILDVRNGRLTLAQHREILNVSGWIALLVGCVEYDMGNPHAAEATRQAAIGLGEECGDANIVGWGHEMQAWFALTQGNYQGVIKAAEQGLAATPNSPVAVQLAAQRAKAWARLGDRRQVELSLDQGRSILEQLEPPANLDNHFVVDPAKFDFYAMDCYRTVGENTLAEMYAHEVIATSTAYDGTLRKPMRAAEAHISLGVIAAREGNLDRAVAEGLRAFEGNRHSLPSLLMVSADLSRVLRRDYPDETLTRTYLGELAAIRSPITS